MGGGDCRGGGGGGHYFNRSIVLSINLRVSNGIS